MLIILMATYNGELFLTQQLESLFSQSVQDFILYVSDDCSTDKTWEILQKFKQEYPDRIFLEKTEKNTGSAKYNFINLLIEHKADYVMLCDQDDIWMENKIKHTLQAMKQAEHFFGKETPILVHTDLTVSGSSIQVQQSFRKVMNADYRKTTLNRAVIQNTITGCTVMINKSLSVLIKTVPDFFVMHDWWLMLIASAFGVIRPIYKSTIYYRQHGKNEIGASDVRTISYKLKRILNWKQTKHAVAQTYAQTSSFLKEFKNLLSKDQQFLLEQYIKIPEKNKILRLLTTIKLGCYKNGLTRNIAYFLLL